MSYWCDLCEQPTTNGGTKRCDRCWELERRIEADPKIAAAILARVQAPREYTDSTTPKEGKQ